MANILILDLQHMGSDLFVDSESFINSMRDLSENELKMTRGGGSKAKASKAKISKLNSTKNASYDCGYGTIPTSVPMPAG